MANGQPAEIVTDRFSHGAGAMVRKGESSGAEAGSRNGKFGRLFPREESTTNDRALETLGLSMAEGDPAEGAADDNRAIPAGFTYLGQFIDHDVTFDPTSLKERQIDPEALENFRSPALDLDSLYGGGRATQPYLYLRRSQDSDLFVIGATTALPGNVPDPALKRSYPNDLPRAANGLAIVPDPRNDENLIVAQLHLAFMKFHNKVVEGIKAGSVDVTDVDGANDFEKARRLVVWHYQWIVLHEFLDKILHRRELSRVLHSDGTYMGDAQYPYIPVEFSMAAYRLGHSMVRQTYSYNRIFTDAPGRRAATLNQLFQFTGRSNDPKNPDFGVTPIPSNWIIDWRRFFAIDPTLRPSPSRLINTRLVPQLFQLHNVGDPNSADPADRSPALSVRNLIRADRTGLPCGQTVARQYRIPELTHDELTDASTGAPLTDPAHIARTPLWFYILKEAEVREHGLRLGRVGSRIVAEVFVGLLRRDEQSFVRRRPGWTPTLSPVRLGRFTMADLLKFVGEINPLGNDPSRAAANVAPQGVGGSAAPTNGTAAPFVSARSGS